MGINIYWKVISTKEYKEEEVIDIQNILKDKGINSSIVKTKKDERIQYTIILGYFIDIESANKILTKLEQQQILIDFKIQKCYKIK